MANHGANGRGNRNSDKSPTRIKRVITSDFVSGREVQGQIMDAIKANGYPDDDEFAIKLSLEEGLINAIKHGNKLDAAKRVWIEASVDQKTVDITIEDEGPGFEKAKVPDPTLEENLEKCSGRGILLIETYMSEAQWTKGGRKLHMVFKRRAK